MPAPTLLEVSDLSKSFKSAGRTHTDAVSGVSLTIGRGEVLALAGESGSGKSTLARLLLGTVRRDSGSISFAGRNIDDSDPKDLAWIRKRCSFVQQDPYDSINPRMRVRDIVAEPLGVHGVRDAGERESRVLGALADVGLGGGRADDRLPHELSGGERQRVAIARALVLAPLLIIADEPVSMLDVSVRAGILDLLRGLCDSRNVAILYITHDLATARHFGDNIALMYRGRIVEYGQVHDVLVSPRHPYTQALLDALPLPEIRPDREIRILESQEILDGCAFRSRCPYAIDACSTVPELEDSGNQRRVACFAPLD